MKTSAFSAFVLACCLAVSPGLMCVETDPQQDSIVSAIHDSTLDPSFAFAYSTQSQTVPHSDEQNPQFTPIAFEINLVSPQGIVHDTSGDSALFTVEENGTYQIRWYMYVQPANADPVSIQVQLNNVSTQTAIPSSLVQEELVGENRVIVVGSASAELTAGTVIELQAAAISAATDVAVIYPLISITDAIISE